MHALVSEAQTVMAAQGDAGGRAKTMREITVLFNGAMVRAILDDRKTQTRRIVKPQPGADIVDIEYEPEADLWLGNTREDNDLGYCSSWSARSPLGKPGDRLWVRETWAWPGEEQVLYFADPWARKLADEWKKDLNYPQVKWKPSIHMPRWAARLFLDVVDVRIERLCDISAEDARAEGADRNEGKWVDEDGRTRSSYRLAFQRLWISVYGAESWEDNPWVWVTEFKRVKRALETKP